MVWLKDWAELKQTKEAANGHVYDKVTPPLIGKCLFLSFMSRVFKKQRKR